MSSNDTKSQSSGLDEFMACGEGQVPTEQDKIEAKDHGMTPQDYMRMRLYLESLKNKKPVCVASSDAGATVWRFT